MSIDTRVPDQSLDAVSGAHILVGDMLVWSDLKRLTVPLAVREVLAPLLDSTPVHRVLLAGPRAGLLVDRLPEARSIDVLVRSLPDARTLADLAGVREDVSFYCGGLDAFRPDDEYDLVIALGGPQHLLGPDSRGLGEAETVGLLAGCLRDGGHLVVDLANELGLDDLVSAQTSPRFDDNGAWHVGAAGFDGRHLFAGERDDVLRGAGVEPVATYAALPSANEHRLLVRDAGRVESTVFGQVIARAGTALDTHFDVTPVLRDPRAWLDRVVEAGLFDALAPAWVVVARRSAGTGLGSSDDAGSSRDGPAGDTAYPLLVEAESTGSEAWRTVTVIDADGGQHQRWADGHDDSEVTEGGLSRLLGQPVAEGTSLELTLRAACATRRHAGIRAAVRQYAEWLRDPAEWEGRAEARFFATPANVVVSEDGRLQLIDATWRRSQPVAADEALVRGLRDFARRLLASARVHPWRSTATPDELAVTLGAMAGLTVTPEMIAVVADVEAEVAAIRRGAPRSLRTLLERNLQQGQHARDLPARDEAGYRELLAHDRTQARVLREKQGQVAWLEGTLRHRDRYIRTLEKLIESYEETMTYRTVQALRAPRRIATRKAVAAARTTAEDALPPDTMNKARKLVAKVLK